MVYLSHTAQSLGMQTDPYMPFPYFYNHVCMYASSIVRKILGIVNRIKKPNAPSKCASPIDCSFVMHVDILMEYRPCNSQSNKVGRLLNGLSTLRSKHG